MKYVLMAVSILLSVVNASVLKQYAKVNKRGYSPFLFNAGVSLVWVVILLGLLLCSDNTISTGALIYGGIYGVILFAFLLFKTQSMATGPVSLSTLIGSCAFVIATGFGVVYAKETVSPMQLIGMGLLIVSLVLCVNPKKSEEKLTGKWLLCCLGFFLAGGFVGILYRLFGASDASADMEVMLLTAALVSLVLFLLFGLVQTKDAPARKPDKNILIYMLLSGLASCAYIRINLSISNVIPSVIFFPVSNGGMVILSTVVGRVAFGEKLNRVQLFGIAIGCLAVVITGCGDYLYQLLLTYTSS